MTTYAVIARFDNDATEVLSQHKNEMKNILSFDTTGDWPPHLTLGCYEADNGEQICQWTEEYAHKSSKPTFEFSSLGIFCSNDDHQETEVIYAVPTLPISLSTFYYGYHEKLDDICGPLGWLYSMKCGQPALHSSIAICKTSEFYMAMDYLRNVFKPFNAAIEAIEVYEVPMKFIARYELNK